MSSHPLFELLERLEAAKIHYVLKRIRDETIMVEVHVPGEIWEIEFFASGEIEIEIFRSDGTIHDADAIQSLFER